MRSIRHAWSLQSKYIRLHMGAGSPELWWLGVAVALLIPLLLWIPAESFVLGSFGVIAMAFFVGEGVAEVHSFDSLRAPSLRARLAARWLIVLPWYGVAMLAYWIRVRPSRTIDWAIVVAPLFFGALGAANSLVRARAGGWAAQSLRVVVFAWFLGAHFWMTMDVYMRDTPFPVWPGAAEAVWIGVPVLFFYQWLALATREVSGNGRNLTMSLVPARALPDHHRGATSLWTAQWRLLRPRFRVRLDARFFASMWRAGLAGVSLAIPVLAVFVMVSHPTGFAGVVLIVFAPTYFSIEPHAYLHGVSLRSMFRHSLLAGIVAHVLPACAGAALGFALWWEPTAGRIASALVVIALFVFRILFAGPIPLRTPSLWFVISVAIAYLLAPLTTAVVFATGSIAGLAWRWRNATEENLAAQWIR